MALKSQATEDAEDFVERVTRMINRKNDVIADVESSINDPNVISPSTVGDKDAWVEVTLYNVSDPSDLFTPREWMYLGEIGADVDTYTGSKCNGYNPTVEISKRFSRGD